MRETQVALHPGSAHVEPAVAKPQRLVDALLVELEGKRRRARDDLELVDLELDCARRHRGVDRLLRARDDLAACAQYELVADLLRRLGGRGRALGVDDELCDARVVAQVDEDEAAVIPPGRDPARKRQRLADVLGTRLAAHDVTPAHLDSLSRSSPWVTASSALPARRMVAPPAATTTVVAAPSRPACVSWPLSDRSA